MSSDPSSGRLGASGWMRPGSGHALALSQHHGLSDLLARVLAGRGVTVETCPGHLAPTLRALMPDPDTVVDMPAAVERLARAVLRRERVAVFGDYDVDGATSAALLASYLRRAGLDPLVHIPDRVTEGYGPNQGAIGKLAGAGATLLVTVDCGTGSPDALAAAKRLGLDTVVIDHHRAAAELPPAVAVVNANRQDDLSGLGHLCAAGMVFMVLVALQRRLRAQDFWGRGPVPDLLAELDLVALGTVADVVPLTGLNRAFVAQGPRGDARSRAARLAGALRRGRGRRPAHHLSTRLPDRSAPQRGWPHRRRGPRGAAADDRRPRRSRPHRGRARHPQSRAPRHRGRRRGRGGGGRHRGFRGRRARRPHAGLRRRRLASRRRRPRGLAAARALQPALLRDRGGGGAGHGLGPVDPRRRSRPRGSRGAGGRPAAQGWGPRHGGGRDARDRQHRGVPGLPRCGGGRRGGAGARRNGPTCRCRADRTGRSRPNSLGRSTARGRSAPAIRNP